MRRFSCVVAGSEANFLSEGSLVARCDRDLREDGDGGEEYPRFHPVSRSRHHCDEIPMTWSRVSLAGSVVIAAPSLDDRRTGAHCGDSRRRMQLLLRFPAPAGNRLRGGRCVILENAGLSNYDTIDASDLGGHAR